LGFLYLLLIPFLALVVWAIMDALVRPDSHWAEADQNKTAWVIALLGGPVVVFPVGIMVSLVYLFGIRPKLTRVARGYTPRARVPPGTSG
jgi:hypothetical protein